MFNPINRRIFLGGLGGAAALASLAACGAQNTTNQSNPTYQGEFSWKLAEGETLSVLLAQHSLQKSIVNHLPEFEAKTGIKVLHEALPQEQFYQKLAITLPTEQRISFLIRRNSP